MVAPGTLLMFLVVTSVLAASQALGVPEVIASADWQALAAVASADWALAAPVKLGPGSFHKTELHQAPAARQLLQEARPYVVAHRGASGPLPEHTVPAYLLAIEQGADFIECDVVATRDLQLICRHEPNLNDTTDAWERFGDRASSKLIDGQLVTGVFASDLTLAEARQLRATQRWPFRNHSLDGQYSIVTFEEFIDVALTAGRPVGIYPEAKHPAWHNQLPAMQAANTTLEQLMVQVLHAKGYHASAPFISPAWRQQPVFIQSFEVSSLRRFSALTPVPLALLLDNGTAPDTGLTLEQIVSDTYLSQLTSFVTVVAPWKALFYRLVEKPKALAGNNSSSSGSGLVLPATGATAGMLVSNTGSSRRLMVAQADHHLQGSGGESLDSLAAAGFAHPDVPLSDAAARYLDATQQLQSTGLAARLHQHGFQVHTYTLRDEGQFVLPTCKERIACEFEWLFDVERLDGAFADWPGTMAAWLSRQYP